MTTEGSQHKMNSKIFLEGVFFATYFFVWPFFLAYLAVILLIYYGFQFCAFIGFDCMHVCLCLCLCMCSHALCFFWFFILICLFYFSLLKREKKARSWKDGELGRIWVEMREGKL